MFIRKLTLTNYKNHEKKIFFFNESMLAFVGLNGVGKTNILDGIYQLCIGKSYFSTSDRNCIRQNENFYRLTMEIEEEEKKEVVITFEPNKKKKIVVNEILHPKNLNHVGLFPVVMVAPNDNVLILGSSEDRRKFIDATLSQISKEYLSHLVTYNSFLKQRNALLKAAEDKGLDIDLLDIYNKELVSYGTFIFEQRKFFVDELQDHFKASFQFLAAKNEDFVVKYKSKLLSEDLATLLNSSLKKDQILKRTTEGIHRDDLVFEMKGGSLKDFGSQGQQKTFLLALKLTQFNFLKAQLNKVPLFIIDDIFDKLDGKRSQNLIRFLSQQKGQVFISNTDSLIFQELITNGIQIIEVGNGE